MVENFSEDDIEAVEYLILLILGKAGGRVSVLHLQKMFFLLWKFHPVVRQLVQFVPHFKGPYSQDLQDIIKNPTYVIDCWTYVLPRRGSKVDKIVGGYVEITPKGWNVYKLLVKGLTEKAKEDKDALNIISAVDLIVPLYSKLNWDELLFLIYTDETNKEFSTRSELSKEVLARADIIVNRLVKKGVITEDMKDALLERAKRSKWIVSDNRSSADPVIIDVPRSS